MCRKHVHRRIKDKLLIQRIGHPPSKKFSTYSDIGDTNMGHVNKDELLKRVQKIGYISTIETPFIKSK